MDVRLFETCNFDTSDINENMILVGTGTVVKGQGIKSAEDTYTKVNNSNNLAYLQRILNDLQ